MTLASPRRGHYLGTENHATGRRQGGDRLLSRGLGECWIEDDCLCFRRLLTRNRILIPLPDVVEVSVGTCRTGRWPAGAPVVSIVWLRDGQQLSSGFMFSTDLEATDGIIRALREAAGVDVG